jgi:TM2 domain-containing membrane protein YozV/tetratricopeptide (TPR) repeat protein
MSQGLCPNCGAAINLTAEPAQDTCAYCRSAVTRTEAEARFAEAKASKVGGTLLIAGVCLANGEYERALSFYDKATEQDEKSAEAWAGRATCLLHIVAPHEDGEPRIKATEAVSAWEIALQFAANPEAIKKRAAKVIAEVVSADSSESDDAVAQRIFHYLLVWALNQDPKGDFLLKAGTMYCSGVAPFLEAKCKYPRSGQRETDFHREFTVIHDKFLKALQETNPDAAKECEARFLEYQSPAQRCLELVLEMNEDFNKTAYELRQQIKNESDPVAVGSYYLLYNKMCNEANPKIVVDVSWRPKEEPPSSAPPQTESNSSPPAPDFKPLTNPPKRIPTALCAIFLGWLGVHKFMLGYTKEGIIQLTIGLLCLFSALIGLIEGIIYLTKSDEEFNRTYIQAKKAWF